MLPTNPYTAITDSRTDKTSYNQLWDVCVAYTLGRQNLTYSFRDKKYVVPEQREVVFNLILNIYRNVTARLAVAYPNVAVYPASPSQEDIMKAKSSELALRYIWAEQDLSSKFQTLAEWLITCGSAGLYTYYDPGTKDVTVKVVSPYDLFYEKNAISEEESSWVAVRYYINKEEAAKSYPDFADMIMDLPQSNRDYSTLNQGEPLPKDTIEAFDIHTKSGDFGVLIGKEWVFEGQTQAGYNPVQLVKYTNIPSVLWGWSMVAPLIDLQTQYNRSRNQIIKNTELMANPKWMIPKTSGINNNSITDKPGEKIYFNPGGGAPTVVPMPGMPAYVFDNVASIQNEMLDISGVHSVSLGKRAIGISSGKAIENLASLDASQLQLTQNNIEKATRIVAKNILILMKEYYSEPKFTRMMDGTGKLVFKELSSTDIVEDPEVFIEAGTLFQSEIQDKEAKILQMVDRGLLSPQEAREQLSYRAAHKDILEEMSNTGHAMKILNAIMSGAQVEIFLDDDLVSFKKVFKELMNDDDKFYSLPQEIQDYIVDLYKKIVVAMKNATISQQQGLEPEHESIIQPKPVIQQNVQEVAALNSNTARGQLVGTAIDKSQKEAELRGAMENKESGDVFTTSPFIQ